MPISSRFVIRSTIILLAIGFLTLLAIVSSTAWLSEKSQSYVEESNRSRALRTSAVELRSALQNASSVAALLLTTSCLVTEIPKAEEDCFRHSVQWHA